MAPNFSRFFIDGVVLKLTNKYSIQINYLPDFMKPSGSHHQVASYFRFYGPKTDYGPSNRLAFSIAQPYKWLPQSTLAFPVSKLPGQYGTSVLPARHAKSGAHWWFV
jgi:hypothetical protein